MRSIPIIGERKRPKYLKILSIAAAILCLVSLLLPWIRYEVKTDDGVINLNATEEDIETYRKTASSGFADVGSAAKTHIDNCVEACVRIYKTTMDSQLTPLEIASFFSNARTAIKELETAFQYELSAKSDYPESMVTSDFIDSAMQDSLGLDVRLSEIRTSAAVSAVLMWLMIAILVGLGGFCIWAAAADRKNFIWVLTVFYGILLLACCIFVMRMNSLVRAELEGYSFLAGKNITPFHIPIWPILTMVCLIVAAVEEYAPLQLWRKVPAGTWTCACSRKNRNLDSFCVSCGGVRSSAKTPPEPPKPKACSHCRKCGRQIPIGETLCGRCRYGESTSHDTGSSGSGEGSRVKIRLGSSSGTDDVPSGFRPPDELG